MKEAEVKQICDDSVKLVAMTSSLIDSKRELEQKLAASRQDFNKGAAEWAEKLVQRGLMQETHKRAFVDDIVAHPERVFAIAEKVAAISMQSIGHPAGIPSGESNGQDPIVRFAFGT